MLEAVRYQFQLENTIFKYENVVKHMQADNAILYMYTVQCPPNKGYLPLTVQTCKY